MLEDSYLQLARTILEHGTYKDDRTGTGNIQCVWLSDAL